MAFDEIEPRPGESYVAFHARLFEKAEKLMATRPEQAAKTRIDGLRFTAADFGTVPGADAAATRTAGWAEQAKTQYGRVGAEVAALEVAARSVKELSVEGEAGTAAAALRGAPR